MVNKQSIIRKIDSLEQRLIVVVEVVVTHSCKFLYIILILANFLHNTRASQNARPYSLEKVLIKLTGS